MLLHYYYKYIYIINKLIMYIFFVNSWTINFPINLIFLIKDTFSNKRIFAFLNKLAGKIRFS